MGGPDTTPLEPGVPATPPAAPIVIDAAKATIEAAAQTPWYRNPVVWSTYLIHAIGFFFLLSPLVTAYPHIPGAVVASIGAVTVALNQLGYQAHSANVRAAELGAIALLPGAVAPKP